MWVFTVDGFFSAVRHRDTPGAVMVRGRAEADIKHLATRLGVPVQTTPAGDYRYRCTVQAAAWASYLTDAVAALDYVNFKAACHGEEDRDRALMRCWAAMADFQQDRQYGTAPSAYPLLAALTSGGMDRGRRGDDHQVGETEAVDGGE